MALTGIFLILFLIVHLIGNLQLLKGDGGEAFNIYAHFMTSNPIISAIAYILYACFLVHICWAGLLTLHNRKARVKSYLVNKNSSVWSSRNMGILGTIILIFLVIHLKNFWVLVKFGSLPTKSYEGHDYEDLYTVCAQVFSQGWYVALYTVSMLFLAFHLWHGFASAFQTLGLNHVKYSPIIKFVGRVYAIVVPLGFASIPIVMFYHPLG